MARGSKVELKNVFSVLSETLNDKPEEVVTVSVWGDGRIRVLSNLSPRHTEALLELGGEKAASIRRFLEEDGA